MKTDTLLKPIEILLVEDNPGDVRLIQEVLRESRVPNHLNHVKDGEEALAFLRREGAFDKSPRPEMIMLDLNLPKKDGREVLSEIKQDPGLKRIPVLVLTTSKYEQDVLMAYDLQASCYMQKPVELENFLKLIRSIDEFWLTAVRLPSK